MSTPAVLFGGPSPEHDVSILTGLQAARALIDGGTDVEAIYWSKTGEFHSVDSGLEGPDFADGVPAKAARLQLVAGPGGGFTRESGLFARKGPLDISAVINCCHGGPGEDGTLQAALDLAGVRHAGPTVAGAALGMDKLAFAAVVSEAGLPHLPVEALTPDWEPGFDGPYLAKPRFGGSSIGVEVVADADTARQLVRASPHFRAGAIIEPYKEGAVDINVALRSHPSLELSAIEKPLRQTDGAAILDYRDKYSGGEGMASAPRELPAQLPEGQEKVIREAATRIAALAGLRGVARLDFLAIGDEVYVNEINTVPGSLARYLWVEPALPFADLLRDLLAEALEGPGRQYTTTGADGAILRSAGSIASKLG